MKNRMKWGSEVCRTVSRGRARVCRSPRRRRERRSKMKIKAKNFPKLVTSGNHRYRKLRKSSRISIKKHTRDFLGGPVVKNPLSNAGDAGSIPGQRTKIHMPWGN